jgi:hypothetical protein
MANNVSNLEILEISKYNWLRIISFNPQYDLLKFIMINMKSSY